MGCRCGRSTERRFHTGPDRRASDPQWKTGSARTPSSWQTRFSSTARRTAVHEGLETFDVDFSQSQTSEPDTRLAILSNSSTAEHPAIREALMALDERYMKLDAGDPSTLRYMNDSPISYIRIIESPRSLSDVAIQTMFISDPAGRMTNSGEMSRRQAGCPGTTA